MNQLLRTLLEQTLNNLDAGNTNISEEEEKKIIDILKDCNRGKKYLSKYQAYTFLNMSRASFDNKVREDLIPKGIKVEGFKELMWKESDLKSLIKKAKTLNKE